MRRLAPWLWMGMAAGCGLASPTLAPGPSVAPTLTAAVEPLAGTPIPAASATFMVPPPTSTRVVGPPTSTPTLDRRASLMAVGDLMLARRIGNLIEQSPAAPFAAVQSVLDLADVFTANLECVISGQGEPAAKAYTFRAPPRAAETLALGGVDAVSLANNHSLDYGPQALADTQAALAAYGIRAVGAGPTAAAAHAPAFVESHGLRLAFLAYVDVPVESSTGFDTYSWTGTELSSGVAWATPEDIASDVAAVRPQADVIIVWLHTGLEGRTEVTRRQRALAHAAIDAGADLVLGAHPHVLQPAESYGGGVIVYSLGNFIFDGYGFPENYSAIFTATLTTEGVESFDWVPVVIEGGLPRPAAPDEAGRVLELVRPAG